MAESVEPRWISRLPIWARYAVALIIVFVPALLHKPIQDALFNANAGALLASLAAIVLWGPFVWLIFQLLPFDRPARKSATGDPSNGQLTDAKVLTKLDEIAQNPRVSAVKRAEASRRAVELRAAMQGRDNDHPHEDRVRT